MDLKRILYLGYYFKELDRKKQKKFLDHVRNQYRFSKWKIYTDVILSSLKYNISIQEYFNFRFYAIPKNERASFAGTGYMYEYQLEMNPKEKRVVLEDKLKFFEVYRDFVKHDHASIEDLKKDIKVAERLISNPSGKLVLKASDGQCGRNIEVRESKSFTALSLIQRLEESGNDLVEEFVIQHDDLMALSPSGLNTVRIITQINKSNDVDILGARLRISVNSCVDNMAAGNIAAPINEITGIVEGPAVYSDITRDEEKRHPVTGTEIIGFRIPFWKETIEMIKKAALINTNNRSIGWDIAITNKGPELIEGNHDWCKLLWQLPVHKGLKDVLENYKRGIK